MVSMLAFVTLSFFAGAAPTPKPVPPQNKNTYTHQAQVVAGPADCATEAKNWSLRFAAATDLKVKYFACKGEQTLEADKKTYKVYNLGLSYESQNPYYPYTVLIGKRDPLAPVRPQLEALYPTMDSCLADLAIQTGHFEKLAGLKAVTATCVADSPYLSFSQYFLKIEGFDNNKEFYRSQPKQSLYMLAPHALGGVRSERDAAVRNFLTSYGATIVKQAPGLYVYYRANGPAPIKVDELGVFTRTQECAVQLASVNLLYTKSGSKNLLIWCTEDGHLQVVHDSPYTLSKIYFANQTQYGTLDQCLTDIAFVLSDSRNASAIGAVCAPSLYDSNMYEMNLFRKGYY